MALLNKKAQKRNFLKKKDKILRGAKLSIQYSLFWKNKSKRDLFSKNNCEILHH